MITSTRGSTDRGYRARNQFGSPKGLLTARAEVSLTVTNTGKRAGDEVVQLYIRDLVSSLTRPVMELKDFKRITLAPGESKTVNFTITPDKLSFLDLNMNRVVEPGWFDIMVGTSSVKYQKAKLEVVAR